MANRRDELNDILKLAAEEGVAVPADILLEIAKQDATALIGERAKDWDAAVQKLQQQLQAVETLPELWPADKLDGVIPYDQLPIFTLKTPGAVPAAENEDYWLSGSGWRKLPKQPVTYVGGGASIRLPANLIALGNLPNDLGWLYNDGTGILSWTIPSGAGDVVGIAPSVAGNFASYNNVTGKVIQDSGYNAASFQAPITVGPALLGNGAMQYQVIVTGATPFAPVYSGFLLDGTTGGKTSFAVTSGKTLTLTAADNFNMTIPATGTVAMLNQANSFTLINPLTTIAESWIGPSSTAGIYFKSGNVGIGTTNPATRLDVKVDTNTHVGITTYGGGTVITGMSDAFGAYEPLILDASYLAFNTGGTEKMRILSGGNVGIGTTSPSHPLHVVDIIASSGADAGLSLYDRASSGNQWTTYVTSDILRFWFGSDKLVIDTGGNVGIGTTSPDGILHTKTLSGTNSQVYIEAAGDDYATLDLKANGKAWELSKRTGANGNRFGLQYYNGSTWETEAVSVLSSGNVGIGTITPTTTLHVKNPAAFPLTIEGSSSGAGVAQVFRLQSSSGKYNWMIGAQYNVDNAFEITPSTGADGFSFSTPAILLLCTGVVRIGNLAGMGDRPVMAHSDGTLYC